MELNHPLTSYHPTLDMFRKGQNRDKVMGSKPTKTWWWTLMNHHDWRCPHSASCPIVLVSFQCITAWKTCLLFVVIPCAFQKVRCPGVFLNRSSFLQTKNTSTKKIHVFIHSRDECLGKWMRRNWKRGILHDFAMVFISSPVFRFLHFLHFPHLPSSSIWGSKWLAG